MAISKMHKAALDYAERGWPIFPVGTDKAPININGVSGATTDLEQINIWWTEHPNAAIGLNCGAANFMTLDYDTKHGETMEELIAAVKENLRGKLPVTKLRSRTPSGGEHHFYDTDPTEIVAMSQSVLAEHVDVRAFQSYVILPPSKIDSGSYEWIEEGTPAFRTDEMKTLAGQSRAKHQDRDNWIIEPDLPENVDWAIGWLTGKRPIKAHYIKPAIEGHGGDHMTFATAAMMKTLGLSEAKAFEVMWEHWNHEPMACPPWDADELTEKIEHAYTYNANPPGHITAAYTVAQQAKMFGAITTATTKSGGKEVNGPFRMVDWKGMQDIEDPTWLVPDLLPEGGFAFLVGQWGTYKTFIALDIALTIATGKNKLHTDHTGMWTARQGPVLFAVGEGRPGLKQRANAWSDVYHDGQEIDDFILCDPVPRILVEGNGSAFVEEAKRHHDKYALVVLDTVGRAMQQTNENSQEAASAFTAMVEGIQRELNTAVLAIHHSGKDRGGPRGSSVFGSDADVILETHATKQPLSVVLRMDKQKDAAKWEKDRGVSFKIMGKTDKEEGTLVAKPGEIVEVVETDEKEDKKKAAKRRKLETLNRVALAVLREDPYKAYNMEDFAEAIAKYKSNPKAAADFNLAASTIRTVWLPDLKNASVVDYPAIGFWSDDRGKAGNWLYREQDDDE